MSSQIPANDGSESRISLQEERAPSNDGHTGSASAVEPEDDRVGLERGGAGSWQRASKPSTSGGGRPEGRDYLPREVFFGRCGLVFVFFPVCGSAFSRFFPATSSSFRIRLLR